MTTNEKIQALRTEAAQAGDDKQVAICDRALAGDEDAIEACQSVIDDAEAMIDD